MLEIIELKTKDEIINAIMPYYKEENADFWFAPMYHGTDYSLVNISDSDRKAINDCCERIMYKLYDFCIEHGIDKDKRIYTIKNSYGSMGSALLFAKLRKNEAGQYRYGEFYITDGLPRAIGYSKEAWILGETGWIANTLYDGTLAINGSIPDGFISEQDNRLFLERKSKEKDPVILVFVKLLKEEVLLDDGREVEDFMVRTSYDCGSYSSYKLKRSFNFDQSKAFMLKKENFNYLLEAIYNKE